MKADDRAAPGSEWKGFVRGALGAGVGVAARAAGALTVNKLVAVWAPAGGLTLLAQFQNLMALFSTLPNDGIHAGLVKYLAPLRPGSSRYRLWLGAAAALNGAALLAGAVLLAAGLGGKALSGPVAMAGFVGGMGLLAGQGFTDVRGVGDMFGRARLVRGTAPA